MAEKRFISTLEIMKKDIKITVGRTLTTVFYTISKGSKLAEENSFYESDSDALYDFNQKVRKLTGYSFEIEPIC